MNALSSMALASDLVGRRDDSLTYWRSAYERVKAGDRVGSTPTYLNFMRDLTWQEYDAGRFSQALATINESFGRRKNSTKNNAILTEFYASIGDANRVEEFGSRSEKGSCYAQRKCTVSNKLIVAYSRHVVRGEWAEAAVSVRNAIQIYIEDWRGLGKEIVNPFQRSRFSEAMLLTKVARWEAMKVDALIKSGNLVQAEIDARDFLFQTLRSIGRDTIYTANAISTLGNVMLAQSRVNDAQELGEIALGILDEIKAPQESLSRGAATRLLAKAWIAQRDWDQALQAFQSLEATYRDNPAIYNPWYAYDLDVSMLLNRAGDVSAGLTHSEGIHTHLVTAFGPNHVETAEALGMTARMLFDLGRLAEAKRLYDQAMPIILGRSDRRAQVGSSKGAHVRRVQFIAEGYLKLLTATEYKDPERAFVVADALRSGSVQLALAESATRAAVRDPDLQDLVTQEQSARREIGSLRTTLSNLISAPAEQRVESAISYQRQRIAVLEAAVKTLGDEIQRRFPDYWELMVPSPLSVGDVQALLRDDEVLVAYYFAEAEAYVWAVPSAGEIAFEPISMPADRLGDVINQLRDAVDPKQLRTIGDIPPFDTALAHRLFQNVLQPVWPTVSAAKQMIVVPHGSLDRFPLSLLVTAPPQPTGAEEVLFEGYKSVAWLARSHALTMLPSATALAPLHNSTQNRVPAPQPFIGFGDPIFSPIAQAPTQTADAATGPETRSAVFRSGPQTRTLASAQIGFLPALPDTRDEILTVAAALNANPQRDVHLGADASESKVKSLDLSAYRVISFATHGLVPGDLDGLSQPALALSSPEVTKETEDGLLTMGEILELRLNADWAALSACNTAAAEGEGAQAVSGLGRAFFYAGARALLVSHWPVFSASTTEMMSDHFRIIAETPEIPGAIALQQAKVRQMLNGVSTQNGEVAFSYAHPIFWAPFTLVGDGGDGTKPLG